MRRIGLRLRVPGILAALVLLNLPVITEAQGLPPEWKEQYGLTGAGSGDADDPDADGRTNAQEFNSNTHPRGFFTRYLAEGAAGAFFDASFALLNTTAQPSRVLMRFFKSDGTVVPHFLVLPALTRHTVNVKDVSGLAQAEFSTVIESDAVIVVDRTMTWDGTGYGCLRGECR